MNQKMLDSANTVAEAIYMPNVGLIPNWAAQIQIL